MTLQPVQSSMFSRVGYDPNTRELVVEYTKSGKQYVHPDVDESAVNDLMASPSIGAHFNQNFRNQGERELALEERYA